MCQIQNEERSQLGMMDEGTRGKFNGKMAEYRYAMLILRYGIVRVGQIKGKTVLV
jgi:hypothetical protein